MSGGIDRDVGMGTTEGEYGGVHGRVNGEVNGRVNAGEVTE